MAPIDQYPPIEIGIMNDIHAVRASQRGSWLADQLGYSPADRTRLGTAILEVGRNIVKYAPPGQIVLTVIYEGERIGIQVIAHDRGPGIDDVDRALTDRFTTGQSLGLGLPGIKRLTDDLQIATQVGNGTTVTFIKWVT
jgi:serine/threonine-protein kinase RsbT